LKPLGLDKRNKIPVNELWSCRLEYIKQQYRKAS
jgi:hypothetical protein